MSYCLSHALREISLIEYYDPNKKLGKTVFRVPTKTKKARCKGSYAMEKPCSKWGIFFVGFIPKTVAVNEHRKMMKN